MSIMPEECNLIIIGASSMGRNAFHYAQSAGMKVKGFLDDRNNILNNFNGYPPILSSVENYIPRTHDYFVCAIGDPKQKLGFTSIIESRGGHFISVIHPSALILNNAVINPGCIIAPYAIISCETQVGRHVIVNDAATIGHDNIIGDGCTISPGSHLAGRVKLERGVFIGVGANVIPDIHVASYSVIGAGAAVVRNVPANTVVAGVPARTIKMQM